ncbi:MAG TPA: hypothetical protein PLF22_10990, partial [Pseudomonadales bacterium]|nr:hypothetical protein [Pseudomonadales bacterium]
MTDLTPETTCNTVADNTKKGAVNPYWIVLLAFCLLSFCKGLSLYQKPLDYDSAYFGTVAKHVVNGFGYATSHSQKMPFNPEITTGPAVIFPLAILVKTFGNLSLLPDLYILTVNLLLLGIFSLLFIKRFNNNWQTAGFLLCLYLWCLLYEPQWWIICIGDQQVLLVMLIAALLISSPDLMQKSVYSGILGFLAGFGVMVKFSFLVALPALLLAFFINSVRYRLTRAAFLLFFLAFAITVAPFYIYKAQAIANLSVEDRQSLQANSLSAGAMRQAAGVGIFLETPEKIKHIKKSAKRSHAVLRNLFHAYGIPMFAIYALLLLPLALSLASLRKSVNHGVGFGTIIAWFCSCFSVWYYAFCLALQSKY